MGIAVNQKEPQYIGTFDLTNQNDLQEYTNVRKMVDRLNHDLVDSGFDQYQYHLVVREGNKVYIEKI